MKTLIYIILTSILFGACSTDEQFKEGYNNIPSDTTITLQTATQNIAITVDKNGKVEFMEINPTKDSHQIYFDSLGQIQAINMKKDSVAEQTLYFKSNGQLQKIISYDNEETHGGAQFILFAPSSTKSLLINHDKAHTPLICGLLDTFKIDTNDKLAFRTLDDRKEESFVEFHELHFDTSFISLRTSKNKPHEITLSSGTKGTFRIYGTLSTTFPKPSRAGIISRFDFNVTFK